MTHKNVIDQLAAGLDLTKTEAGSLLSEVVSELSEQLGEGVGFSIPGLGTFKTRIKEVQKVYNPHYGKYMLVPPKRVIDFTPGKPLKEKLKFTDSDHE